MADANLGTASVDVMRQVEAVLRARLPGVFQALGRKINIDDIKAASGTIRDLDIDRVVIGEVSIDRLTLQGTTATIHSGNAFLQDVSIVLRLGFTLEWEIDLIFFDDSGTEDLGTLVIPIGNIGNIRIPSLEDINLTIPSVAVENLTATIAPIINLDLGGASLQNLDAKETTLPTNGFQLSGLNLGNLILSSLGIPATSTEEVTVAQFRPNSPLLLPGAQITQLQIPSTVINDIQSGAIAFDAVADDRSVGFDLGFLEVRVVVHPVVDVAISSLRLQGVDISVLVNQARIDNARVPVEVRGVILKGLDLAEVNITGITL
jgi:hypothetical protein